MPTNGFISKLTQLVALYVVYVFLSGWTFFDYYFRDFGIDPRWLDLPVQEMLVKGFTILLTSGAWLWPVYILLIVVPLVVDGIPALHSRLLVRVSVGIFLLAVLLGVYFVSKRAGLTEAKVDKGDATRLSPVTFVVKACRAKRSLDSHKVKPDGTEEQEPCAYSGNIVTIRNGTYYIHRGAKLRREPQGTIALEIFRAEELTEIQIAGH